MGGLGDDVEDYGVKGVISTGPNPYKKGGEDNGLPKRDGEVIHDNYYQDKDGNIWKRIWNNDEACSPFYLPEVEERDIPNAPNCKKSKKKNEDDISPEEFHLNKVRDFFGLETLEGVKANNLLETSADLFKTKNAEHGDAYLKIGYVLESMFPEGLTLKTHHDFNKFTTLVQMLYKITRMCNTCFGDKETIHDSVFDSPRDLSVYGAIFGEIQIREFKDKLKNDNSL
jgi:hypothetical protein